MALTAISGTTLPRKDDPSSAVGGVLNIMIDSAAAQLNLMTAYAARYLLTIPDTRSCALHLCLCLCSPDDTLVR